MSHSLQEQILVVLNSVLFAQNPVWQGIQKDDQVITSTISTIITHQEYIQRSLAEENQNYKQIIPYLIFKFTNTYFVMQRKITASEQRLAGKLSLGIGGHMRKEDMEGKTIFEWAQREFHEEVSYSGNLKIRTLGILNDDSNDVGKVHLGIVLLVEGDNNNIFIKNEHKTGKLMTQQECLEQFDAMENWSQTILRFLL